MAQGNLIDRAISNVAPGWGAKRMLARAQIDGLAAARAMYDGATRGHRAGFRAIGGTSANAEVYSSLERLRNVSRELDRNNPIAGSCKNAWSSHGVGAGIIPAVVNAGSREKKNIQALIKDHLDTPAIDFDARNTLYGLQNLLVETLVRDGEVLLVRYKPPASLRLPVPLQVRVLEADYLDTSRSGPTGEGQCFQGIEFDKAGRRVAYWLHDEHPGGGITWKFPTSQRVPASDVVHMYRVDRPGQMRGIPWCAPAIVTMWDLHDYEDAELLRQKIAACFAVFITGDAPKNLAQGISATEKTSGGTPLETVEPGMIARLNNGSTVQFASPPASQSYKDVVHVNHRKIAVGYGVPYEIATGDLSQVSFISGRLGLINFNRNVEKLRWHIVIPHGCSAIARWFLESSAISLNSPLKARLDWTPPKREYVDPKSEIDAQRDAIRAGLSTRSEEQRQRGYDPAEMDEEAAEDNKRGDRLGLRFDSDGRYSMNGGGVNPQVEADEEAARKKPAAE